MFEDVEGIERRRGNGRGKARTDVTDLTCLPDLTVGRAVDHVYL